MILDCSSRETALKTVAEIHGVQQDTLQTFFDRWPPHRLENPEVAPEDELWRAFRQAFPTVVNWEATVWFHMSRVPQGTTFREGIQPLGERIESIWASLKELGLQHVTDAEWEHFRNNLGSHHHASLYWSDPGNVDQLHVEHSAWKGQNKPWRNAS